MKSLCSEFALKRPYDGEYQDKSYDELPIEIQGAILYYKIDIREILNSMDEEIRDLFSRINKHIFQLNKQELRRLDCPSAFV